MSADAGLRPVLWCDASIENPGKEVFVVETSPEKATFRAFEGEPGDLRAVSVDSDIHRVLEKAKLWLRGEPSVLADGRVATAMATALVSLFERGLESPRYVSITIRKKDPEL